MTRTVLRRRTAPASRPRVALVFGVIVVGLVASSCGGNGVASPGADASVDIPSASPSTPAPSDASPSASPATSSPATPAPSGSSAGAVDACSLLAPLDEVEKIVGMKLDSTTNSGGGWSVSDCVWNAATGSFIMSVGTDESFRAFGDPGAPDAKARLAQFRQEMSAAGSPRDIDDIGDGAVVFDGGMAAYKAGTYVEVLNLKLTEDQLIKIVELAIEKA